MMFILPVAIPSTGVDVTIGTTFPEFILDDNITIEGTVSGEFETIQDDSAAEFSQGTLANVTVDGRTVYHKPELKFDILNNGKAILEAGGSSAWDKILRSMYVLMVNGTYYMYYTGGTGIFSTHIGLATSTDGLSWTKYSGNPVLRANAYSGDPDRSIAAPIVYHNGTTFFMYYSRWDGSGHDINLATSTDGTNWTKYANNPVIDDGPNSTSWNADNECSCIYKEGTTYYIFFNSHSASGPHWLGIATSTDLKNWTPHTENPLRKGDTTSWEKKRSTYGTLEKSNGTYRLWSSSGDGDTSNWWLGWLWSDDAINFTDSGSAILAPKAGTIYAKGVRDPVVFDEGDHYIMFCKCYDTDSVMRYCAFKVTKEKMNGTYASKLFDIEGEVIVNEFVWNKNISWGGQIDLYFRWGNDTANLSQWTQLDKGNDPLRVAGSHFQYKVEFNANMDWMRSRFYYFRFDYISPISSLMVKVADGQWKDIPFEPPYWSTTVNLSDGDYTITIWAQDSIGNEDQSIIPVKVDLFPPTGNISLSNASRVTYSSHLFYTLRAIDTHKVTHYRISTLSDFSDTTWQPFVNTGDFSYDGPDGQVVLFATFRDEAGRISAVVSDTGYVATGVVEVDYSPTFQLSSTSLLIIIIIIVVVGLVVYYMWKQRPQEE
jgi:predicted GH43/DUF377 family glycosyl hydrolase